VAKISSVSNRAPGVDSKKCFPDARTAEAAHESLTVGRRLGVLEDAVRRHEAHHAVHVVRLNASLKRWMASSVAFVTARA